MSVGECICNSDMSEGSDSTLVCSPCAVNFRAAEGKS